MGLSTAERKKAVYFIGYEVEHTVCYGMKTLFVVGTPPVKDIIKKAIDNACDHVYFGTSQSFNPKSISNREYKPWDDVVKGCLDAGYWVTLDFDVTHAEGVLESCYNEYKKFVPMISVKLPYINQFNYNATIKLDDTTWGHSNPGVWTHPLNELMTRDTYTHWDQYTQDETIK